MKVSYRQMHREAVKLFDENGKLKKELGVIVDILRLFSVKLYKLSPEDEVFKRLKPEFMEMIKNAASIPDKPQG